MDEITEDAILKFHREYSEWMIDKDHCYWEGKANKNYHYTLGLPNRTLSNYFRKWVLHGLNGRPFTEDKEYILGCVEYYGCISVSELIHEFNGDKHYVMGILDELYDCGIITVIKGCVVSLYEGHRVRVTKSKDKLDLYSMWNFEY